MRQIIEAMEPDTFCTLWLASGGVISGFRDKQNPESTPSGWLAFFYERSATGHVAPIKKWAISGNSIEAIATRP